MIAAVPTRIPEVTNGDLSSKGTMFLFTVISAFTKAFSASFPEIPLFLRSINIMWLSVPPEIILYPLFTNASAIAFAFFCNCIA
ncbi:hypothetical protein D3C85_1815470 [compost metagenome]